MLLCFVDESNHKTFNSFAGLIADGPTTKALTEDLSLIMRQLAVDWGLQPTTEFHAHPIFHEKEEWEHVPARARVSVFFKVIEAICAHDVDILLRSVDSDRLRQRQEARGYPVRFPPEQVCFQHILQRVDRIARRRETHALVIADNRSDRERHRERFATYQTLGTPGVYMHTTLDTLLDTVHFAPSHQSRMLQAADMLAFVYRRRSTVTEKDARAAASMEKLWKVIVDSGKLYEPGSWP